MLCFKDMHKYMFLTFHSSQSSNIFSRILDCALDIFPNMMTSNEYDAAHSTEGYV